MNLLDPSAYSFRLMPFWTAFAFVFLGGFFIPLPQEAVLAAVGYLFADQGEPLVTAVLAALAAVVVSDNLFYLLSRLGSALVLRLKDRFNARVLSWATARMKRKPGRTIFIIRFIPGVRVLAPILAALFHVPILEFEAANALAAAVYVPAYVALGFLFHGSLASLLTSFELGQDLAFVVILLVLVAVVVSSLYRRAFRKSAAGGKMDP